MPVILFKTNLEDKLVPCDFEVEFVKMISELMNKPLQRIKIEVETNKRILAAGTRDPAVICQIYALEVLTPTNNVEYSKPLLNFVSEKLKVPIDRVAIMFCPIERHNIAAIPQ